MHSDRHLRCAGWVCCPVFSCNKMVPPSARACSRGNQFIPPWKSAKKGIFIETWVCVCVCLWVFWVFVCFPCGKGACQLEPAAPCVKRLTLCRFSLLRLFSYQSTEVGFLGNVALRDHPSRLKEWLEVPKHALPTPIKIPPHGTLCRAHTHSSLVSGQCRSRPGRTGRCPDNSGQTHGSRQACRRHS